MYIARKALDRSRISNVNGTLYLDEDLMSKLTVIIVDEGRNT